MDLNPLGGPKLRHLDGPMPERGVSRKNGLTIRPRAHKNALMITGRATFVNYYTPSP
jgi:hypothetical protein